MPNEDVAKYEDLGRGGSDNCWGLTTFLGALKVSPP